MDWAMVILFVHADGCYSWQWTQTQKNKPQKLVPQSSPCSALIPWVEGLFLGNWNGKWCITELPGFHFLPILMQNGSCSCSGKPRHGDSAFLSPNWWHWAQNLKNCYKCCNLLHGWGCIWEPLCLFFFLFFASVGKTVFLFHPNRELRSSFRLSSFQSSLWPLFLLELEESPLTVKSDMATIVKVMQLPDSGLEIRDRMWLKITISNAVIGKQIPGVLVGGKKPVT